MVSCGSKRDSIETLLIVDTAHNNYLLLDVGWNGMQRIHYIIAHLRIHNGKVGAAADTTDHESVRRLLDAEIPRVSIVLAFYAPQKRAFTEFAVA